MAYHITIKFYQQVDEECTKTYRQLDSKGAKYRNVKNRKVKLIINMEKELQGL